MSSKKFCIHCGTSLVHAKKFCTGCGSATDGSGGGRATSKSVGSSSLGNRSGSGLNIVPIPASNLSLNVDNDEASDQISSIVVTNASNVNTNVNSARGRGSNKTTTPKGAGTTNSGNQSPFVRGSTSSYADIVQSPGTGNVSRYPNNPFMNSSTSTSTSSITSTPSTSSVSASNSTSSSSSLTGVGSGSNLTIIANSLPANMAQSPATVIHIPGGNGGGESAPTGNVGYGAFGKRTGTPPVHLTDGNGRVSSALPSPISAPTPSSNGAGNASAQLTAEQVKLQEQMLKIKQQEAQLARQERKEILEHKNKELAIEKERLDYETKRLEKARERLEIEKQYNTLLTDSQTKQQARSGPVSRD